MIVGLRLFVIIMAIGCKNFHIDFGIENAVHQAVFLRYFAAPAIRRLPFQRFGMTGAGFWVSTQFIQKPVGFCESLWFIFCKTSQIHLHSLRKSYLICHSPDV